jgi:hypothetical protein
MVDGTGKRNDSALTANDDAPILVELDIFSGRPNPRWPLSGREAQGLRDLHSGLPLGPDRVPAPPGLGYRGFTYDVNGASWRAYGGHVTRSDGATASEPSVERYLLGLLPRPYADLRPRIKAALR